MILACPDCGKRYRTDPRRIPRGGGYVRCPACRARIPVGAEPGADTPAGETAPESDAHAAPAPPEPAPEPPQRTEAAAPPPTPPRPDVDAGVLHLLAEEGLLAARDLDEVREWIFEGRIWPDNLVFVPGEEARRADAHPLTRDLFGQAREGAAESEEKPEPPATEHAARTPEAPAAEIDLDARDGGAKAASGASEVSGASPATATAGTATAALLSEPWTAPWPAPPAESEVDLAALRARSRLTAGVRAFGLINLLLSLTLPPNPLGLAAAVGLLRGRAWGRTLTTVWAGLQILILLIAWSGFTALLLARGALASPPIADLLALRLPPGQAPLAIGVAAFGALGAYLVVQWSYLARPGIASRFEGGGERAALWSGWLLGWAYLSAVALATLAFAPLLASWGPLETLLPPEPDPPAAAAPAPSPAPAAARVHSADGRVSIEVPPRWTVTSVAAGPDANLGVLLQGTRTEPAGKVRVSTARPEDVDRMNRRFDKLEGDQETLRSVEDVAIGDLIGRRIVLSSRVPGGMTGQVLLSLHDGERGYQFSCAATGPGFDEIRPECDGMAQSLLILREPGGGGTAEAAGEREAGPGAGVAPAERLPAAR